MKHFWHEEKPQINKLKTFQGDSNDDACAMIVDYRLLTRLAGRKIPRSIINSDDEKFNKIKIRWRSDKSTNLIKLQAEPCINIFSFIYHSRSKTITKQLKREFEMTASHTLWDATDHVTAAELIPKAAAVHFSSFPSRLGRDEREIGSKVKKKFE